MANYAKKSSQSSESSYLSRLRFDPKLLNSKITFYLTNPRLLVLLIFAIVILGIAAYFNLPRTLNPEIKIPIIIVSTILPGASPSDVESLLTVPLEDALSNLSKVKTIQSSSLNSSSIISIQFESGVDPEKARSDVQTAIDRVNTLPTDAKTPSVQKVDFENQPIWTFAITSNTNDVAGLIRFSKALKEKIKDLPSIDKVETTGLDEQEVQIILKPEILASYGINPFQISSAITTAVNSYPAGSVTTKGSLFDVTINQQVMSVQKLRDLLISINGRAIPLSTLATIQEISKPNQPEAFIANHSKSARPAVTFNVFRTSSVNIDKAFKDAEKEVKKELETYTDTFTEQTVLSTVDEIDRQFNELLRDFGITIVLMFAVIFIFLGIRQAFVSTLTIPFTFLISFIVMNMSGLAISFISLFSLLLALGLLVDDAIVVISAMTMYDRTKKFTPIQTGLLVWRDFVVAIFTTTLTTVWAFLPLLLSSGIIGEFIKPIPIVVSSTLMASFIVALFITLPIIVLFLQAQLPTRVRTLMRILFLLIVVGVSFALLPKGPLFLLEIVLFLVLLAIFYIVRVQLGVFFSKPFKRFLQSNSKRRSDIIANGFIHFERINVYYRRLLHAILASSQNRRKAIAMVIIFSLFAYLLLPLGFVKNEFFPKGDQDYIYVTLEHPSGTNLANMKKELLYIMNTLRVRTGIEFLSGNLQSSFSQGFGSGSSNANSSLITIRLLPKGKRNFSSIELGESIRRDFANYHGAKLTVVESTGGPPAGADLQIKLFGNDLTQLNNYADQIQNFLKTKNGVTNINKFVKSGTSKLAFVPDYSKIIQSNLSSDTLGFWLRLFSSGIPVKNIKFANQTTGQDIVMRVSEDSITPEVLTALTIPSQNGTVSLANIGSIQLENNPTLITREDGKRTLSVTAAVKAGFSTSTLNTELEKYANSLKLAPGYTWQTGGVNEENQNSVSSILQAMLLSFLLIIITMVIQFASFRRALIVMLVIPLSIAGVFIVFAVTRTPLSFPALIGVLALFGIVVKNSILIVDKIVQNEKIHMSFTDSIIDGSSSRLEAIALTSFTAIVGLIPVTLSDPFWRGLGGAIIAGLIFSGTIMLFFIPLVYYYWFNPKTSSRK